MRIVASDTLLLYSPLVLVLSHRHTETGFAGKGAQERIKIGEAWGQNSQFLVYQAFLLSQMLSHSPFLALSNFYCLPKGQNGVSSASQNLHVALPVSSSEAQNGVTWWGPEVTGSESRGGEPGLDSSPNLPVTQILTSEGSLVERAKW